MAPSRPPREAEVRSDDSDPPLDPSDAERLDADLARYDL